MAHRAHSGRNSPWPWTRVWSVVRYAAEYRYFRKIAVHVTDAEGPLRWLINYGIASKYKHTQLYNERKRQTERFSSYTISSLPFYKTSSNVQPIHTQNQHRHIDNIEREKISVAYEFSVALWCGYEHIAWNFYTVKNSHDIIGRAAGWVGRVRTGALVHRIRVCKKKKKCRVRAEPSRISCRRRNATPWRPYSSVYASLFLSMCVCCCS